MTVRKIAMSKANVLSLLLVALGVTVLLGGCDLSKNYMKADRAGDMEVQDYRDAMAPREPEMPQADATGSGVPPLLPYVAPVSEHLKPMPLVSISVNQTVPLRDVLFELADQADYDIELDPRIRGSIIFTARNRPFDLVVDRIAEMAGLRYEFKNDMLRVELDTPFLKNYKVDYLNLVRTSSSDVSNNVSVVSGDGADTGSSFEANNQSDANFWEELNTNLEQILGAGSMAQSLRTSSDPRISAVAEAAAPVAATAPAVEGGEEGADAPAPSAPPAVLRVDSLPVDGAEEEDQDDGPVASFAINRQAGIISVYATKRQHREVEEYLTVLRRSVGSQVLIEAKVLEVSLNDRFQAGIDWTTTFLSKEGFAFLDASGSSDFFPDELTTFKNVQDFVVGFTGNDIAAAVEALSQFGTVRALASPRLTVLNNQSAVLNVADNIVYFEIDIDQTTEDGVTNTEIDSEVKSVPEGVLINVMPSIDLERNEISMVVRPTITRIVDFKNDPAVAFLTNAVVSEIPVVNIQEMDSIIKIPSGQAIVMGGLMQDTYESTQNAVPVLGEVPVLGALFRSQEDTIEKTELVVFLKATIIENGDNIHPTDKDLYRTFSQDRRPLRF